MKLAALLASLPDQELHQLAAEHLRGEEIPSRHVLCGLLETTIRNFRFVHDVIYSRQPPAFAILLTLLDAPDHRHPSAQLRETVAILTRSFVEKIADGRILDRDEQLRLYRRVLYEARRSDLDIEPSEAALLAVLRRELGIAQVEHFFIEHHPELREFWDVERSYFHEVHAFTSSGLLFIDGPETVLPSDLVPLVRQALGVELSQTDVARLYAQLSNQELYDVLAGTHLKTTGSKDQRGQRLLDNMVQPSVVLSHVSLASLRDVAKAIGAALSGSKEQLIERIVAHVRAKQDEVVEDPSAATVLVEEPRALTETRFKALFGSLRGNQLADILGAFPDARQSGTKDVRTAALWGLKRSEVTLLSTLTHRDLDDVLWRLRLKMSGSKRDRIDRIILHFAALDENVLSAEHEPTDERTDPMRAH